MSGLSAQLNVEYMYSLGSLPSCYIACRPAACPPARFGRVGRGKSARLAEK